MCSAVGRRSPQRGTFPRTAERDRFQPRGRAVPEWYRRVMAMNLRLTDEESEALRAKAEQEGRSMQEVARTAISQYVSDRPQRLLAAIHRVRIEDQELLERLSK